MVELTIQKDASERYRKDVTFWIVNPDSKQQEANKRSAVHLPVVVQAVRRREILSQQDITFLQIIVWEYNRMVFPIDNWLKPLDFHPEV